jgi:hypothetical protein
MSAPKSFSTRGEHQYKLPVVTEQMPPRMATLERASRTTGDTEYVSLEPFREAWRRQQRLGATVGEVARRMGADRERVAVLLGAKRAPVKRQRMGDGTVRVYPGKLQQRVTYDVGVKLCRALEVDPWAVGV